MSSFDDDDDYEMWLATRRPLAEPPIFNYERFVEEWKIPSDARLRRLFAKDIAMGYRYRDVLTEKGLIFNHLSWAHDLLEQEVNEERKVFYKGLRWELAVDWEDVGDYWPILREAMDLGVISELGLWEYRNLDEDGGTTEIQRLLNKGSDIFHEHLYPFVYERHCKPAFEMFGHLIPPGSEVFQLIQEAKADLEEERRRAVEKEQSRHEEPAPSPTPSTTSTHSIDSNATWQTVTAALEITDPPPTTSTSTDPLDSIASSSESNRHHTSDTESPQNMGLSAEPSAEQRLTAENAALKKRIAELELANETAKRRK